MTNYVCGFLFDKTLNLVVLIEKLKPSWQKDYWNGVGGHVEAGETSLQAMTREFNEEAGLELTNWRQYCTLRGQDFQVDFFWATLDADKVMEVKTMTDEKLGIWSLARVSMWSFPLLPNLRWILPMAILSAKQDRVEIFNIYLNKPERE